jgi:esterase FrsA
MQEEEALNLSERLFSKVRKVQETSTISNSAESLPDGEGEQVLIEGVCSHAWYRIIRRSYWIWQGPIRSNLRNLLAYRHRTGVRSREGKLDTLQGYAPGNWIYEFSQVAGEYFKKGKSLEQQGDRHGARKAYLRAARYYSFASYPHLKGDELAEQAQLQGNQAYREAGHLMPVPLKILDIPSVTRASTVISICRPTTTWCQW